VWFWDQHDLGRIKSWWNTNINHQYKLTVLQLSMIKWGNKCGEKFTYYIVPKNGIFCYVCKYDYKQCLSWKGLQCCKHTVKCKQTNCTYMKTRTNLLVIHLILKISKLVQNDKYEIMETHIINISKYRCTYAYNTRVNKVNSSH